MGTTDTPSPEGSQEPRKLRLDALVHDLLPDPAEHPPDVIVLVGFLGRSSIDSYWRVYLTPELDDYLEVSEDDIVRRVGLSPGQSPIGGSVVWVRASAKLRHTRVRAHEAQAAFLRGDVRAAGAGMLTPSDPLGGAVAVAYPRTYQVICAWYTVHPDSCWRPRRA
jgi:hypothetical protein